MFIFALHSNAVFSLPGCTCITMPVTMDMHLIMLLLIMFNFFSYRNKESKQAPLVNIWIFLHTAWNQGMVIYTLSKCWGHPKYIKGERWNAKRNLLEIKCVKTREYCAMCLPLQKESSGIYPCNWLNGKQNARKNKVTHFITSNQKKWRIHYFWHDSLHQTLNVLLILNQKQFILTLSPYENGFETL